MWRHPENLVGIEQICTYTVVLNSRDRQGKLRMTSEKLPENNLVIIIAPKSSHRFIDITLSIPKILNTENMH